MKVSKPLIRFIAIRALMAVLLFLTLAAWALGSAVGSSPDEDFVLTSIWCGTEGKPPYCRPDPDRPNAVILPTMAAEPSLCFRQMDSVTSAACQKALYDQELSTVSFNTTLYPSQYLDIQRIFVSTDVEVSVVKMRLLNSFLAATLIVLAIALDRRRLSDAFLTWLAVFAPVATYFIASVNTSSWTLIGTTCFTFAFISALKNQGKSKIWIPASILAIFSVWFTNSSRYEGKYTFLFLSIAILISQFAPKNLKLTKKSIVITALIVPILYLIYKYFSNVYGRISLSDDPRIKVSEGITTTANNLLIQNFLNLPTFIMGFFGSWGLGWFELKLTSTVWYFTLQAFLLTTVFALRKSINFHRLIFGALFTIMCSAILYANQQTFSTFGNDIQPRYFLPLFLGIVIIAAANKTVRFPNSLVITVAILATISNSIALRDTIRRYTTGQDVFISKSLNNPIEWWWQFGPQPETVWLTGTLALAGLFAVLIYERNKDHRDNPELPVAELTT